MKEINIQEETDKFLVNWFKKFVGKYIYFNYKGYKKGEFMNVFFVEKVELRNGRAKAKTGRYDIEENKQSKCSWSLIQALKYKWVVIDKEELNKFLILESLK